MHFLIDISSCCAIIARVRLATIGHDPERFWLKTFGSYESRELARGNGKSMKLRSGNRSSQELRESEAFGHPVDQKPKGFWKKL